MYNFKSQSIFPLLPYKVAKENDCKVVIRSNKTAEESHKLNERVVTKIAKHIISM